MADQSGKTYAAHAVEEEIIVPMKNVRDAHAKLASFLQEHLNHTYDFAGSSNQNAPSTTSSAEIDANENNYSVDLASLIAKDFNVKSYEEVGEFKENVDSITGNLQNITSQSSEDLLSVAEDDITPVHRIRDMAINTADNDFVYKFDVKEVPVIKINEVSEADWEDEGEQDSLSITEVTDLTHNTSGCESTPAGSVQSQQTTALSEQGTASTVTVEEETIIPVEKCQKLATINQEDDLNNIYEASDLITQVPDNQDFPDGVTEAVSSMPVQKMPVGEPYADESSGDEFEGLKMRRVKEELDKSSEMMSVVEDVIVPATEVKIQLDFNNMAFKMELVETREAQHHDEQPQPPEESKKYRVIDGSAMVEDLIRRESFGTEVESAKNVWLQEDSYSDEDTEAEKTEKHRTANVAQGPKAVPDVGLDNSNSDIESDNSEIVISNTIIEQYREYLEREILPETAQDEGLNDWMDSSLMSLVDCPENVLSDGVHLTSAVKKSLANAELKQAVREAVLGEFRKYFVAEGLHSNKPSEVEDINFSSLQMLESEAVHSITKENASVQTLSNHTAESAVQSEDLLVIKEDISVQTSDDRSGTATEALDARNEERLIIIKNLESQINTLKKENQKLKERIKKELDIKDNQGNKIKKLENVVEKLHSHTEELELMIGKFNANEQRKQMNVRTVAMTTDSILSSSFGVQVHLSEAEGSEKASLSIGCQCDFNLDEVPGPEFSTSTPDTSLISGSSPSIQSPQSNMLSAPWMVKSLQASSPNTSVTAGSAQFVTSPIHGHVEIEGQEDSTTKVNKAPSKATVMIDRILQQMTNITTMPEDEASYKALNKEMFAPEVLAEPETSDKWRRLAMTHLTPDSHVLILQKSLAGAILENDTLQLKMNKAARETEIKQLEFQSEMLKLQEELNSANRQVETLKLKNDDDLGKAALLQNKITELEKSLTDIWAEKDSALSKAKTAEDSLQQEQKMCENAREEVNQLQGENEQLREQLQKMEKTLHQLQMELSSAQENNSRNSDTVTELQESLAGAQQDKDGLVSEIQFLRSEYNSLRQGMDLLAQVYGVKTAFIQGGPESQSVLGKSTENNLNKDTDNRVDNDTVSTNNKDIDTVFEKDKESVPALDTEGTASKESVSLPVLAVNVQSAQVPSEQTTVAGTVPLRALPAEPTLEDLKRHVFGAQIIKPTTVTSVASDVTSPSAVTPVSRPTGENTIHDSIITQSNLVLKALLEATDAPADVRASSLVHWEDVKKSIADSLISESHSKIEKASSVCSENPDTELKVSDLKTEEKTAEEDKPAGKESSQSKDQFKSPAGIGVMEEGSVEQVKQLVDVLQSQLGVSVSVHTDPAGSLTLKLPSSQDQNQQEDIGLKEEEFERKYKQDKQKLEQEYENLRKKRLDMLLQAYTGKEKSSIVVPAGMATESAPVAMATQEVERKTIRQLSDQERIQQILAKYDLLPAKTPPSNSAKTAETEDERMSRLSHEVKDFSKEANKMLEESQSIKDRLSKMRDHLNRAETTRARVMHPDPDLLALSGRASSNNSLHSSSMHSLHSVGSDTTAARNARSGHMKGQRETFPHRREYQSLADWQRHQTQQQLAADQRHLQDEVQHLNSRLEGMESQRYRHRSAEDLADKDGDSDQEDRMSTASSMLELASEATQKEDPLKHFSAMKVYKTALRSRFQPSAHEEKPCDPHQYRTTTVRNQRTLEEELEHIEKSELTKTRALDKILSTDAHEKVASVQNDMIDQYKSLPTRNSRTEAEGYQTLSASQRYKELIERRKHSSIESKPCTHFALNGHSPEPDQELSRLSEGQTRKSRFTEIPKSSDKHTNSTLYADPVQRQTIKSSSLSDSRHKTYEQRNDPYTEYTLRNKSRETRVQFNEADVKPGNEYSSSRELCRIQDDQLSEKRSCDKTCQSTFTESEAKRAYDKIFKSRPIIQQRPLDNSPSHSGLNEAESSKQVNHSKSLRENAGNCLNEKKFDIGKSEERKVLSESYTKTVKETKSDTKMSKQERSELLAKYSAMAKAYEESRKHREGSNKDVIPQIRENVQQISALEQENEKASQASDTEFVVMKSGDIVQRSATSPHTASSLSRTVTSDTGHSSLSINHSNLEKDPLYPRTEQPQKPDYHKSYSNRVESYDHGLKRKGHEGWRSPAIGNKEARLTKSKLSDECEWGEPQRFFSTTLSVGENDLQRTSKELNCASQDYHATAKQTAEFRHKELSREEEKHVNELIDRYALMWERHNRRRLVDDPRPSSEQQRKPIRPTDLPQEQREKYILELLSKYDKQWQEKRHHKNVMNESCESLLNHSLDVSDIIEKYDENWQ